MKTLLVGLAAAVAMTGCMNGRSGPGQLTRSQFDFKKTAKSEEFVLDSHKDVVVDELERTAPDGSTIRIRGYKSRANDAAIEAGTAQAQMVNTLMMQNAEMMRQFGGLAAQYFSGGAVRPQPNNVPATVVLTNAPAK